MQAELWIILFQALCHDAPNASAALHCGHARSEELRVEAYSALCFTPQIQVNSDELVQF